MKRSRQIATITGEFKARAPLSNICRAFGNTSRYDNEPKVQNMRNMPRANPKSPILLTTKAFLPAMALSMPWYQNPIRRYEARPTPSQPTNITR